MINCPACAGPDKVRINCATCLGVMNVSKEIYDTFMEQKQKTDAFNEFYSAALGAIKFEAYSIRLAIDDVEYLYQDGVFTKP